VAQIILNIINLPNPEVRNPVGKDAESIFKGEPNCLTKKWISGHGKSIWIRKGSYVR